MVPKDGASKPKDTAKDSKDVAMTDSDEKSKAAAKTVKPVDPVAACLNGKRSDHCHFCAGLCHASQRHAERTAWLRPCRDQERDANPGQGRGFQGK